MKIFVIGGGTAGLSFLKNLDGKDKKLDIVLVEKDKAFFNKSVFIDWLTNRVSDKDFFVNLDEFKDRFSSFKVINDKAVRINFDKNKIFFKDNPSMEYDKLVLACGSKPLKADFSGRYKRGVYYLADCDPLELKDIIQVYAHIIIYLETGYGLELVEKLTSLPDKDIKLVAPDDLDWLSPEDKDKTLSFFKENNIDFYSQQNIQEALGESRIRAVKFSSGKFVACDNLILDKKLFPRNGILKDCSYLFRGEQLQVSSDLSLDNSRDCFVCGDMVNRKTENAQLNDNFTIKAKKQGESVANNIFNI